MNTKWGERLCLSPQAREPVNAAVTSAPSAGVWAREADESRGDGIAGAHNSQATFSERAADKYFFAADLLFAVCMLYISFAQAHSQGGSPFR